MPKSETNVPIMTRSKKEATLNDPKLSLNEVKNEATSKTITEKDKMDTVVKQVQPVKEIMKTDVQVEKNMLDQSVEKKTEKKFVIEKSTDKDRSSSKNVESLILEKNKPKDPSALKKDESLIHEKNVPKEEVRSFTKKDEHYYLETNKSKEEVRSSTKKDESIVLEKNVVKEEVQSSSKKDEFCILEKNKPKEEDRSSPKKNESLILEKNVPKEELRSSSKKDESVFLEKNKLEEADRSSQKKDEFLFVEKNITKEEVRSSKKDECSILEKNKPKEEVRPSSQKDEFVIVEKNKPKEDDQPSLKKEELFIIEKNKPFKPSNVAVPRKSQPYVPPITNEPPIVLATHLVPSLPITLFELLAEVIEVATERPVNLLYEPRSNRKVAKNITDIAVLSANEEWEDGNLLPVSFIFKHRLNKDNSPSVYADVIIASDLTPHVEDIIDMRGHRCALPDRSKKVGATTLLYNYLHTVGEGPAFFGNTLDVDSQIAVLQMVAGKQAEVGILEAPVIMCHKDTLPGIESLRIVTSLGPLPPYRIMVNKTLSDNLVRKLTSSLLNCNQDVERMEKLASFGILGFAINSTDFYEFSDVKSAIKRGPYY
ncbi:titin-like isoform X19 [Vespula squamosa]|uniref:Titin-like isoform X19 n=1 Tax=Vespula squamosa TaxID=30214 RepID=A0ABD2ALP4_VESSQ